jgi:hypothetical protein
MGELSVSKASEMISGLLGKAEQSGHAVQPRKINEPRLGMAMKECWAAWQALVDSIQHKLLKNKALA